MKYIFVFMLVGVLFQSCLETRDSAKDVEEKQQLQKQVGSLQRTTADVNSKFQETDDSISKLSARMDVIDNHSNKNEEKLEKSMVPRDQKVRELTDKLAVHQEIMTKMDAQITALQNQVTLLSDEMRKAPVQSASKSEGGEKVEYKVAEEFFEKKQWQDAAISFEKYRKQNPKGKHAAEALYKIGVSFQELGSKDEAKVFFKDVVSQYPNSTESKKASTRMKAIK